MADRPNGKWAIFFRYFVVYGFHYISHIIIVIISHFKGFQTRNPKKGGIGLAENKYPPAKPGNICFLRNIFKFWRNLFYRMVRSLFAESFANTIGRKQIPAAFFIYPCLNQCVPFHIHNNILNALQKKSQYRPITIAGSSSVAPSTTAAIRS